MSPNTYRGRIAPSPTGLLHLGHAKTFWTAFMRCRQADGVLIYRDEDIDPLRCRQEFSTAAVEDLKQLGIIWDVGPIRQSERLTRYRKALESLIRVGCVYPCYYTRKEIGQFPGDRTSPTGEVIYPVRLRPEVSVNHDPIDFEVNWRFRVPDNRDVSFFDGNQGPQAFSSQRDFGDFLVWRKEGVPAYELAVVVDDADMKITEVVRGADLLLSTARQWLLYEALGLRIPEFYHVDLVCDEKGQRLAKHKDSLALRILFRQGHTPTTIARMWSTQSP